MAIGGVHTIDGDPPDGTKVPGRSWACWCRLLFVLLAVVPRFTSGADVKDWRILVDRSATELRAGDLEKAKAYLEEAYLNAIELADSVAISKVLVERAAVRQVVGDLQGALQDLYDALRIYDLIEDPDGAATVYNSIGALHHNAGNYKEAIELYGKSLAIRVRREQTNQIAILYGNLGSALEELGRPDSALIYHRLNLAYRKRMGGGEWVAICYANLGSCLARMGRTDSALYYLHNALATLGKGKNPMLKAQTLAMVGQVEVDARRLGQGRAHCEEGLRLAERLGYLSIQKMCQECLYRAFEAQGDAGRALTALQRMLVIQDSLLSRERAKGLMSVEMNYAFERQLLADSLQRLKVQQAADLKYQMRITQEWSQKRVFSVGVVFALLLAIGLWSRLDHMRRSRNQIDTERAKGERLLLNILPHSVAEELKASGHTVAKDVESVSILFTDFTDFAILSERMSAKELVALIDTYFRAFDRIARQFGLEKIKTIGDAYMCAGGLPESKPDSAVNTVRAALAMQRWVGERAAERSGSNQTYFNMRCGIHTGAVVAGVVGDSKFQYDVWGATVNTAARMESSGEVGRVNISHATYELVKEHQDLVFTPRGRISVKGMGELEMWFVEEVRAV